MTFREFLDHIGYCEEGEPLGHNVPYKYHMAYDICIHEECNIENPKIRVLYQSIYKSMINTGGVSVHSVCAKYKLSEFKFKTRAKQDIRHDDALMNAYGIIARSIINELQSFCKRAEKASIEEKFAMAKRILSYKIIKLKTIWKASGNTYPISTFYKLFSEGEANDLQLSRFFEVLRFYISSVLK